MTRVYGVQDNPKGTLEADSPWMGTTIGTVIDAYDITVEDIWGPKESQPFYLWNANLYTVEEDRESSVQSALRLCRIVKGRASADEVSEWLGRKRLSLCSSFNKADVCAIVPWKRQIEDQVLVSCFVDRLMQGEYYEDALKVFGDAGIFRHKSCCVPYSSAWHAPESCTGHGSHPCPEALLQCLRTHR